MKVKLASCDGARNCEYTGANVVVISNDAMAQDTMVFS